MEEKTITLDNGEELTFQLSEEWEEITFWQNGKQIEDCAFQFADYDDDQSRYLLKWMYSPPKFTRQSIGEKVLRFFIENTGATIWTREIGETDVNDGSHLTGVAIPFVRKMQDLGLIERWRSDIEAQSDGSEEYY